MQTLFCLKVFVLNGTDHLISGLSQRNFIIKNYKEINNFFLVKLFFFFFLKEKLTKKHLFSSGKWLKTLKILVVVQGLEVK